MIAEFFAPTFKVTVNGIELNQEVLNYISQISVVTEPDTVDQCSLTLANPFPDLRWTHHKKDAALFGEGNAIQITMGYIEDAQPMFDGEITSISPVFPESGTPTVSIEGRSRLHRLKVGTNTRTFQKVTDKQMAQRIADDLALELQADDTKQVYDYVIQYNQTDLAFLLERAKRIHFEIQIVDAKTLKFQKSKEGTSKTYTLVWGSPQKNLDAKKNLMPLKNFTPTMDLLRPVNEVVVRGHDPKTKKPIFGKAVVPEDKMGEQTGAELAVKAFKWRKEEIQATTPIATKDEADRLAQAILNDRALELLTGSGSTIGIPDLRAGNSVELAGLGPRFSTKYYVTQATHTIGSGGYQTSFRAKSNGSNE